MTGNVLRKVRDKRKAWRKYLLSHDPEDYKYFARLRNQVRWETRKANVNFEKKLATEIKLNPKAFWKYAQKKTSVRHTIQELHLDDLGQKTTTNSKEMADVLNSFFCSVFTTEDLASLPRVCNRSHGHILSN